MRPTPPPVRLDRRGVATTEFVLALPVCLLLMFGLADIVQLARGHLRVQSAAMQIVYRARIPGQ
jgi:Flp pilus assembly protein TadG